MSIKLAFIGTFLTNILFGQVCMMPMAVASDMPMHHDDAMEMVMTPMEPMSSANCDHCVHLENEEPAPMDGGCAGHCLSTANDVGAAVVQGSPPTLLVALPPSFINVTYKESVQSFVEANAPPSRASPTRTIVLLQ